MKKYIRTYIYMYVNVIGTLKTENKINIIIVGIIVINII